MDEGAEDAIKSTADVARSTHDANKRLILGNESFKVPLDNSNVSDSASGSQQQPNCDASEALDASALMLAAASKAPELRRYSSISGARSSDKVVRTRRSRSCCGGDDDDRGSTELVLQLQKLCRRQRQRSEERAFVRDIERVLMLLKAQTPASDGGDVTSDTFSTPGLTSTDVKALGSEQGNYEATGKGQRSSATRNSSTLSNLDSISSSDRPRETLTLAEIDALLDCIADLFDHRNASVRALAFEVVHHCLLRFGERLTLALRRKIYLRLEIYPPTDFLLRQKALRALTQDGRHLEPFQIELGWFLLRLLEQSDAQRDLLGLIQHILQRSPRMLDRDKVIAIVALISARCEIAWSRNDLDACRRFIAFYHVLAAQDLAFATSTLACLRSLCCIVNADGHGTWSIMKHLLNGTSGFLVLRGLLQVLEHSTAINSAWVLRGAVFFIGMSCWGSQRVAKFDDLAWAPILLELEKALQCCRGVVIFEVILSIQRLIKKFGAAQRANYSGQSAPMLVTMSKTTRVGDDCHDANRLSETTTSSPSSRDQRHLVVEWDIILRMLQALRPWVSMTDETIFEGPSHQAMRPENQRVQATYYLPNALSGRPQQHLPVSIQQTRIPRELLDTLQAVEDLVDQERFAGDVGDFLNVLEDYLPHLSEQSMLFLLRQRAIAAHPGYQFDWLTTLSAVMRTFFLCMKPDGDTLPVPTAVRLEALKVLQNNLWTSRNICEDRVIDEVVIPTLGRVYEDPTAEVRRRALAFIIEVAQQLESVKFDSLLDILASSMTLSSYEDAQLVATSGIVTLFSSAFDHLPPARAVRMYDLLATTVETHRNRAVRHAALSCMLCVCEARATDGKLQWKERQQERTSRFLFVSRRAARTHATGVQLTATCVPVARALRALLTLISAEPDAEIFCMGVEGIKLMLENRVILEDVDVSEVLTKVVASINYRAFGRAAIPDEIDTLLRSEENGQRHCNDAVGLIPRHSNCQDDENCVIRSIPQSDAERVRSLHASARTGGRDDTEVSFCANVRATATLLAKTRFLGMGLELLQLLASYEVSLDDVAKQKLAQCLIGVMKLRLVVAEKDLIASGDNPTLSTSASSPDVLFHDQETKAQVNNDGLYPSDTPLGFTSRVLSRFQTSASQGNLFHALSGSVNKSLLRSASAQASVVRRQTRKDRMQLQNLLCQLFEAEFKLLHATTTTLSLLALLFSTSVLDQLNEVLECLHACVTTVDGDFRPDACVALLELLSTIVPLLTSNVNVNVLAAHKAIVKALLLGFEYAKSKQVSYLAFRLLCQIIQHSDRKNRISLATQALPTLWQCTRRTNSLLAEAAIDYLMCYAYSRSALAPSAFRHQREFEENGMNTFGGSISKSWIYERSILTIKTTVEGDASLIIRRANCTSRWELDACFDLSQHSEASSLFFHLDERYKVGDIYEADSSDTIALQTDMREVENAEQESLSAEFRPSHTDRSNLPYLSNAQVQSDDISNSHNLRSIKTYLDAAMDQSRTKIEVDTFQHASALPPLPAYDGIGGSPSYFCDNASARRSMPQKLCRSVMRDHSSQSKGDYGQESSPCKPAICAIRELEEENEDDQLGNVEENENGGSDFDKFSLNDKVDGPPHISTQALRDVQIPIKNSHTLSEVAATKERKHPPASLSEDRCDPTELMMQLFDLTTENRPKLLSDGPSLKLALSVLDRTPAYETHKIGLLYVRDTTQSSEAAILGNGGGSLRYLRFLRGLGTFTKLQHFSGYSGGLDTTSNSDGKFGLFYQDACTQIMFHVATMMRSQSDRPSGSAVDRFTSMKKKRHIGNDFVHVVYKECDKDYNLQTLSGQFNDVHIIIQPINDREYRTEVHVKAGISPFGPLYGKQIVSSSIISESVRLTCLNANLACQVFHQDLVGFSLNCEERLKQIKQLGLRLATTDEWKLE